MSQEQSEIIESITPSAEATQTPAARPRYGLVRRVLRAVFWSALLTFSTVTLLLVALLSWLNSDSGRYYLVDAINRSGLASVQAIEGSFWSELQIRQLKVVTDTVSVELDYGVLHWEPYLLLVRDLSLPRVSLGQLDINTVASPPDQAPSAPPGSLSLPLGIHLDELKIAKLRINGSEISEISGSVSSNGRFHRLHLNQLRLPQGQLAAALNITGKAPFLSAGSFIFSGQLEGQDIRIFGQVEGPLRQLKIDAIAEHAKLSGRIGVQADVFAPYAYQMVKHGEVTVKGLDPQLWSAAAPKALLDVDASFNPGKDGVSGQIRVKNHLSGPLDQQKMPLQSSQMEFSLRDQQLHIAQWRLQLSPQASIQAQGVIEKGQLKLDVTAAHLDPKALWSPQAAGDMSGKIKLSGPWLTPGVKGEIQDLQRKASLKLDLGWINPSQERRLAIREAQLTRGASLISAQGEFNLLGKNDFKADLLLKNINPAEFLKIPGGRIDGKINAKGVLKPKPLLDIQYLLGNSQFNGQSLAGQGQLKLDAQRLSQADLWLSLGNNKLSAQGNLGAANDRLNLTLQAPNLALLGAGFQGRLDGSAVLTGPLLQPRVNGSLNIEQLLTPFALKIQSAQLSAAMSPDLQGALQIEARVQKLSLDRTELEAANLKIGGSLQQHTVNFTATGAQSGQPLQLELAARGGINAQQVWQGEIQSFSGLAGLPFKLQNSPKLRLAADEFELSASALALGQSQIQLLLTRWKPGLLETQGQIKSLAVAEWLALGKVSELSTDLLLAGDWNLKQSGVLNGALNLQRVSGDLRWRDGVLKPVPLALSQLSLSSQITMNQFAAQAQIGSTQFGQLSLTGDSVLDLPAGGLALNAPVNASIKGQLPDLAVLSPFLGPDVRLAGKADLDVQRRGTLAAPQLAGSVRVSNWAYSDSNLGLKLRDGLLDIALNNQQINVQALSAKDGGKGELSGSGVLDFSGGKANGNLNLAAKRFTLISKPEMLLVMSGKGSVAFKDNDASIWGDFKVDSGDIQFQSNDVPTLSKDVTIIGRKKPEAKALAMKLQMQLDVDLGDNFMFRGYGLESRLAGKLRIKAAPNTLLTATGTINTEEGEYKAYGQKLEVERGILSFQGAIDNPSLDILAIRRNQAVEAGVEVKGSAYSPRVSLYSEPTVPDSEKISWLLFGHGSDSMEKSDGALVLQLLNAMASNGGGQGLTDEILGNFGIDEVGYKSKEEADGTTTQVVTVSKRLSKSLRVALEKSFNGLSDAVNFTLQLSRNWSVVSRIGVDESSLDVKYTLNFD